jgi:hypothetical protein
MYFIDGPLHMAGKGMVEKELPVLFLLYVYQSVTGYMY